MRLLDLKIFSMPESGHRFRRSGHLTCCAVCEIALGSYAQPADPRCADSLDGEDGSFLHHREGICPVCWTLTESNQPTS